MTEFKDTVFRSYPTGSRYICNPPPTDTDNDTVFLVNGFYDYGRILAEDGWEDCGEYDNGGNFQAFRKGDQNYIVTENDTFFERYVVATEGAKALNLLNKEDRIKLFQSICDAPSGHVGFRVTDPLVPNKKVQIIDFEAGPVDRNFFEQVFVIDPFPPQPVLIQDADFGFEIGPDPFADDDRAPF